MTNDMTIASMTSAMERGELTAVALTQMCLDRISQTQPALNAFVDVAQDALVQAQRVDEKRKKGEKLGVLAGIPVAIKDNLMVQGWEVTSGSRILAGHRAVYHATVIERLLKADAILIGRTNMDEFAMGSSNETSCYGPVKNPWEVTCIPGGSSGGSACAVAANCVPLAIGSDTGGSVRQPAALCGVVGLKPTYGRVSRHGLMALSSSLDQIGPFAHTVEDAALLLQVIEGHDPLDSTSANIGCTEFSPSLSSDLTGVRIGIPREYFIDGLDPEIHVKINDVCRVLESLGAICSEISLPHASHALPAYYIIQPAEASSNMGRYDGLRFGSLQTGHDVNETYEVTRGKGFGAEVKRRIMLGTYTLSAGYADAYYHNALKVRTLIKQDFDEAFSHVDVILTPTSPCVAWPIGEKQADPVNMYLSDIFTVTANLVGLPGISIPCGFVKNLPVGFQLMGRAFDESVLLKVGSAYQSKTSFHLEEPPILS